MAPPDLPITVNCDEKQHNYGLTVIESSTNLHYANDESCSFTNTNPEEPKRYPELMP
jgi:hypothetical protein